MKKNTPLPYPACMVILLIISFRIFMGPSTGHPVYPDMDMNATPNPVGSGARAMGMGGAFISVADDATAASWNPAGLRQILKPEVSVVGSWFSGRIDYQCPHPENADIEDTSPDRWHINYLSAVIPMDIFGRNLVFSLNYQHLYEFSKDSVYTWRDKEIDIEKDILKRAHKRQRGALNAISPAVAGEITDSLFVGLTANLWPHNDPDNGWENINIVNGQGTEHGRDIITHYEIYEKYEFSGFNMHLGFLYLSDDFMLLGKRRQLRIGGVFKTPFEANIRHEQREVVYTKFPNNPGIDTYDKPPPRRRDLTLKMPPSYGIGFSLVLSNHFSMALDVYRTHWEDYLLRIPSGKEYSPINKEEKGKAGIKTTTQLRIGGEYRIQDPKKIIPIRFGVFYDPEPAPDRPYDFYGISLGSGITYKERFSFDMMYQFRFGKKRDADIINMESISSRISQHYIHVSFIYYYKD